MKKSVEVSYARFIAMIMIVLCHYFQFFNIELAWWLNVGVQVFLIISGFLYGQREIKDPIAFCHRRCKKVLIPIYIYILGVTIYLRLVVHKSLSIGTVVRAFTGARPYEGTEHLWFIPYIMFCYFITPLLYALKKKIEKKSIRYKALVLGMILISSEILYRSYGFYFWPSRVICYIMGYFWAIQVDEWEIDCIERKRVIRVIIIFATFLNGVRIYFKYIAEVKFEGIVAILFDIFEQYSHVALGLALFVVCLELLSNAKYNFWLKISDKYSYYIYIVHHLIVNSSYSVFLRVNNTLIGIIASVLIILLSAYVLYMITIQIDKIREWSRDAV